MVILQLSSRLSLALRWQHSKAGTERTSHLLRCRKMAPRPRSAQALDNRRSRGIQSSSEVSEVPKAERREAAAGSSHNSTGSCHRITSKIRTAFEHRQYYSAIFHDVSQAILCLSRCPGRATTQLASNLLVVERWLCKWRIKINEQKCKHIPLLSKDIHLYPLDARSRLESNCKFAA
ncbi:uncharacterized protein LOC119562584 isoform X1 [Drosophila subpulchrella]|uniref:uncharacterized protein LOC119562584 isoform X1 n=1 Tax=Drosophila subpulchrella TaxID=1486046 RepID=UPI0018A1B215|nr:uncharacterized protein LOC119562584 isoform X1 [Drosophila subpulchrella]